METPVPESDESTEVKGETPSLESGRFTRNNYRYFSNIPVPVQILHGEDYAYDYANPAACRFLGAHNEDFIGKSFRDICPPELNPDIHRDLKKVYTNGEPHTIARQAATFVNSTQRHSGYFTINYQPLWDTTWKEVLGIILTIHWAIDHIPEGFSSRHILISESENDENASASLTVNESLKKQNDFIESVLDSATQVIIVYDKELRFAAFNRKAEEQFGLKKNEVLGKNLLDVFPQMKESKALEELMRAFSGEVIHKDHHKSPVTNRYYEIVLVPLKDGDGNIYAVLVTAYDITVLEEAIEKVSNAHEIIKRKNKDLEQFAYVVSHDLQEPLRKIRTFADRLKGSLADDPNVNKIIATAKRMSELVDGLLSFSRFSDRDKHFVSVDLNEILKGVTTDLELAITQKDAIVTSEPLPIIRAIPVQIRQLFYNLLNNSLKFSSVANRPVITIQCHTLTTEENKSNSLQLHEKYYLISFSDNGIGFDAEQAKKIFSLFYRAHGASQYPGSGIGLSVCKKVVDNHNGKIYASSAEGQGARFDIILPAGEAS